MIRHYLKIAFRLSGKTGRITFVNILGLAVGLASCILIFIYLKFETGYDKYHKDNKRLFRIEEESTRFANEGRKAACRNFVGLEIEKMDEVEVMGRISGWRPSTVQFGSTVFKEEKINLVSGGLFDVLSLEILEGFPSLDMKRPFTTVISETIRNKYFGSEPACGKILRIDTLNFEVVGVIKDMPPDSHFHSDILLSFSTRPIVHGWPDDVDLYGFSVHTYIKLKENVDPELFGKKIFSIAETLAPEYLKETGDVIRVYLKPVSKIHLSPATVYSMEPSGNARFLSLMGGIGLLILIATCLNYMNLSTARFICRAKETGIRKTFGAGRSHLVLQFIGESVITVFIAHLIAMALAELGLDSLNRFTGLQLIIPYDSPALWIFLVFIIVFTALTAGSYPAAKLSSVDPVEAISGSVTPGKSSFILRRILIFSQFVISIFLIMATMIITRQVNFLMTASPGFDREQKLVFQLPEGAVTVWNYKSVKEEFGADPLIIGTSISSSVPGRWLYNWALWPNGEKSTNSQIINCFQVDYDFLRLYGLELIAGEVFDPEMSRRWNNGWLINETAIKTFGWASPEEALTKFMMDGDSVSIRGVVKDYHFKGLNQEIGPLAILLMHEDFRYITLSFDGASAKTVLDKACDVYSRLFSDYAIDYFFLDEDFALQYEKEKQTGNLVTVFTILAVFIACLGLYGMTAYSIETRKRAYSLMKVNGASSLSIYAGILKEFLFYILISFAVITPVVIYAGTVWLRQFPYHTGLSPLVFVSAALILFVISFGTVNLETFRIFRLNPAETVRNQ